MRQAIKQQALLRSNVRTAQMPVGNADFAALVHLRVLYAEACMHRGTWKPIIGKAIVKLICHRWQGLSWRPCETRNTCTAHASTPDRSRHTQREEDPRRIAATQAAALALRALRAWCALH